jgi:hypothetical protein
VQTQEIAQALRKSGVSEKMVSRTLMGDFAIKRATSQFVGDLDQQERERVEGLIDYLRQSEETGPGLSMYFPTKTGSHRPNMEMEDGVTRAGVGQWADLADKLGHAAEEPGAGVTDSIGKIRSAVKRIHDTAEELKGRGIDLQTSKAARRKLRQVYEEEFAQAVDSGAFTEVEEFFAKTLQQGARSLVSQMAEMEGTYLGGEYKLAAPQVDMARTFDQLSGAFDPEGGPSDQFREQVKDLVERNHPEKARANTNRFDDIVDEVAGDLHQYMKTQTSEYGDAFNKWRGMGVGEGFIARSKAEKVAEAMRTSHQGWERELARQAESGEPTNLQAQAQKRLRDIKDLEGVGGPIEASQAELALTQKEARKPGSTPGILAMNVRQPDFTATGGYEMSRLTALGDETIRALGGDPEHIHTVSHPLASWSRKEDFDFDLNYMATIDDTVAAHLQRRTRAQSMPADLANLWQIMEEAGRRTGPEGRLSEDGGPLITDHFETSQQTVSVEVPDGEGGSKTVDFTSTRVTSDFEGDQTFTDGVEQFFSSPGMALRAAGSGKQARTAYALQKSIVGQFGAFAKKGAIQTRQRLGAFDDLMSRLVEERENLASRFGEVSGELTGETAQGKADRAFRAMFNRPTAGDLGEDPRDAWTFMKDAYARMEGKSDALQKVALAEMEITQSIAIEKYKSGDPQQLARKMNSVIRTLHGNPQGGYKGFEDAFSALMEDSDIRDNLPFTPENLFGEPGMPRDQRMERAREAFKLQHDMHQSMRIARQAGIGSDYAHAANVPAGEIDAALPFAMSDATAERRLQAESLQRGLVEETARALGGRPSVTSELENAATQFFAAEEFQERRMGGSFPRWGILLCRVFGTIRKIEAEVAS